MMQVVLILLGILLFLVILSIAIPTYRFIRRRMRGKKTKEDCSCSEEQKPASDTTQTPST